MKFRKKPIEVIKYTGELDSLKEIAEKSKIFLTSYLYSFPAKKIELKINSDKFEINIGDYVVIEPNLPYNKISVCSPDIFEKTYEPVHE